MRQHDVFNEMSFNFARSIRNEGAYSDTWSAAFARKGSLYGQADLEQMLAPGNRANALIRNLANYLDSSGFNKNNSIHRELLAIGESTVGKPFADLTIDNQVCSSLFLFNLMTAAEIIGELRRTGNKHPRVLEIGGGYGTLCGLLRAYYGSDLTVFAADLPETLALQEWYLRTRFPDAPTTFKADRDTISFAAGGLNFINAHVLETQPFAFDIAINIISMGEMHSKVAHGYLRFVEQNICPGGFFYFMNAHAQCVGGTPEVTEYDFDALWSLTSAKLLTPFDDMAWMALMRFILTRTTLPRVTVVRRWAMRLLLNEAHTGFLDAASIRDEELVPLSEEATIDASMERLATMIGDTNPALAIAGTLTDSVYVPQPFFDNRSHLVPVRTLGAVSPVQPPFASIKRFEGDLITAMRDASKTQHKTLAEQFKDAVRDRDTAVSNFLARLHHSRLSEYWTSWAAAMLGTLRHEKAAESLILARVAGPQHLPTVWLTRLAFLLQLFSLPDTEALSRLVSRADASPSDRLKLAEMLAISDQRVAAYRTLDEVLASSWHETLRPVLVKTALRIGRRELALSLMPSEIRARLDIAVFAIDEADADFALAALLHGGDNGIAAANDTQQVAFGAVLLAAGDVQRGAKLIAERYDAATSDYFALGNIGSWLYWAGMHDWAEEALIHALALGPRNVQQLRYIGLARMSGGAWAGAAACFAQAATIVPHLPALAAREAFCRLPAAVRAAGFFGKAKLLNLIFQDEPTFYHDIGFKYK